MKIKGATAYFNDESFLRLTLSLSHSLSLYLTSAASSALLYIRCGGLWGQRPFIAVRKRVSGFVGYQREKNTGSDLSGVTARDILYQSIRQNASFFLGGFHCQFRGLLVS